ncbi:Integrase catalytic subunit (fragment) [Candidatus Zixiibacteriota bacterium]
MTGPAKDNPAFDQLRVANELKKGRIFISPAGVRCVWLRHDLGKLQKHLKALEAKMAQENLILTESRRVSKARKKAEAEECGEIEIEPFGLSGSTGNVLCGDPTGSGKDSLADFHRHLHQSSLC